jgi:hypothetical protein
MRALLAGKKSWLLTLVISYIYFLAAAASLNGIYDRWHFREDAQPFSFEKMYDETAKKPFVYRQLLPRMADVTVNAMPEKLRTLLQSRAVEHNQNLSGETRLHMVVGTADKPRYALPYLMVYYMCFISLFGAMFAGRAMLKSFGFGELAASGAPLVFIILFPAFETVGGYYYDCSEIGFIFLFAAMYQWRLGYLFAIPVALLATYNKESFPFFLAASVPLLLHNRLDVRRAAMLCAAAILSVAMHLVHVKQFASNPGGETELHFGENVIFYLNPLNLLHGEGTYRVIAPSGYNILLIAMCATLAIYGRRQFSTAVRLYLLTGGCVAFPLLLLFAAPGELRNLSILYPALLLFIATSLQRMHDGPDREWRMACAPQWAGVSDWLLGFVPRKLARRILAGDGALT